jgi:hypothetical protein
MMQYQENVRADRELGVRSSLVVAEFNLEFAIVEPLDHSAHLTPNERMLGHVHEQGDDIENVDSGGGRHEGTSE